MARQVMCLVGLPGSGKTYIANDIIKFNPEIVLIDDPMKGDRSMIEEVLKTGKDIVVCDPWLCDESNRANAERFFIENDYTITWFFFEPSIEKCKRNISYRDDGRIIEDFDVFNYAPPRDCVWLTIWQPPIT